MKAINFLPLAVMLLPGCALIDAASGDDSGGVVEPLPCVPGPGGTGDCQPRTCVTPLFIGGTDTRYDFDTCAALPAPEVTTVCASAAGGHLVMEFSVGYPSVYEICVDSPIPGTLTVTDGCNGPSGLINECTSSCISVTIDPNGLSQPNRMFAIWTNQAAEFCGPAAIRIADVGIQPPPPPPPPPDTEETGANCLDSRDNDGDGLNDCEDETCQMDPSYCDSGLSIERCNGQDEGPAPQFPMGSFIDELACSCVDTGGCDNLRTAPMGGQPYLCHFGLDTANGAGVCGPNCNDVPWCQMLGGTCSPEGECVL